MLRIAVRLTPRGGRDRIDGWAASSASGPGSARILKARVAAPPADGAANAALIRLLAKALGVPKSAVSITAGATSRLKRIEIAGDPEPLARRLDEVCDSA